VRNEYGRNNDAAGKSGSGNRTGGYTVSTGDCRGNPSKTGTCKRKNIRNRIKKRDHEQMETHADRLAAAGSVVGIPVCVHDLSYRKKYYQQFLSG
jgi:hypothetical protein